MAFARAVEPDNAALAQRVAAAESTRARSEPTVPSDIALELATNPFLRCDQAVLQASLRSQGKLEGDTTADVFTCVRSWKDHF